MRGHPDFRDDLSLVAEVDGQLVGAILCTRSRLVSERRELPALTFGLLCVHPARQRQGIGRALVERVGELGRARGFVALVILGHPHNYVGYGFKNGIDLGIVAEDGSRPCGLLAKELSPRALAGSKWTVHFSSVFELPSGLAEFDADFPALQKEYRPSQELFSMALRARMA